jgi:hypothetical protein
VGVDSGVGVGVGSGVTVSDTVFKLFVLLFQRTPIMWKAWPHALY